MKKLFLILVILTISISYSCQKDLAGAPRVFEEYYLRVNIAEEWYLFQTNSKSPDFLSNYTGVAQFMEDDDYNSSIIGVLGNSYTFDNIGIDLLKYKELDYNIQGSIFSFIELGISNSAYTTLVNADQTDSYFHIEDVTPVGFSQYTSKEVYLIEGNFACKLYDRNNQWAISEAHGDFKFLVPSLY